MSVQDYHLEADLNLSISGISVAEGCAPSGMNDAIRQLMADVKKESEAQSAALASARSEQAATDAAQDAAIAAAQSSADVAQSSADGAVVSAAIDGLDLVLTFGNGTTSRVQLPAGKSVGDLWLGFDPESRPANVQLYAGQLLSRSSYAAHSALVLGGSRTVLTEDEWQARVAADGFCPFYSSGDGSTTYRMPLVKGVHPEFVAALAEAGQYKEAGLPNITGTISMVIDNLAQDSYGSTNTIISESTKILASGNSYGGGTTSVTRFFNMQKTFDASLSSPVYRDDCDTVQPPSLTFLLGEYVVGTVAPIGEADATSILDSVTQLESEMLGRSSVKAYIVETWSEGTEWYRRWSDGWIEQRGVVTFTTSGTYRENVALTFPVEFRDVDYVFHVTGTWGGGSGEGTNYGDQRTTTGLVYTSISGVNGKVSWSAEGFAKE